MKKFGLLLLVVLLAFTMTACSGLELLNKAKPGDVAAGDDPYQSSEVDAPGNPGGSQPAGSDTFDPVGDDPDDGWGDDPDDGWGDDPDDGWGDDPDDGWGDDPDDGWGNDDPDDGWGDDPDDGWGEDDPNLDWGEDNPTQPGGNDQKPTQPGGNDQKPTQPGGNDQKPTQPGGNDQKPTQPGGNDQKPAGASKWAETKTGKFYSQFSGGSMYLKLSSKWSQNTTAIFGIALKGNKIYLESGTGGVMTRSIIWDEKNYYVIDKNQKIVAKLKDFDINEGLMELVLNESKVNVNTMVKGERTISGKKYDTEEWNTGKRTVIMCFDGAKPAYIVLKTGSQEIFYKIDSYNSNVNNGLFSVPSGYRVITV